jgi:hypothetical protein
MQAMTDKRSALIEAVAQEDRDAASQFIAIVFELGSRDQTMIEALWEAFARHRQAAIASVIAHATSDEAVERARRAWNETPYHRAMKAAILAAINERQS